MPPQILQKLGDAISGVDRDAAYMEGLNQRTQYEGRLADVDYTRAQTDAAIELARQRRAEAEAELAQQAAIERVRGMNADQMFADGFGDIVASELGSSYSGATQGRLHQQEFTSRGTIQDPAADQAARIAAAQSVSPAQLSREGLGDDIAYEVTRGENGEPVLTPARDAAGRVAMSRLSPNDDGSDDEDELFESADSNAIRGAIADFYGGVYDPVTGRISGLNPEQGQQALQIGALAAQIFGSRRAPDHQTAVAMAIAQLFPEVAAEFSQDVFPEEGFGDDIDGSGLEDDDGLPEEGLADEGDVIVNRATGERLQLQGGQWVPAE